MIVPSGVATTAEGGGTTSPQRRDCKKSLALPIRIADGAFAPIPSQSSSSENNLSIDSLPLNHISSSGQSRKLATNSISNAPGTRSVEVHVIRERLPLVVICRSVPNIVALRLRSSLQMNQRSLDGQYQTPLQWTTRCPPGLPVRAPSIAKPKYRVPQDSRAPTLDSHAIVRGFLQLQIAIPRRNLRGQS